jgi:hypothetical protein
MPARIGPGGGGGGFSHLRRDRLCHGTGRHGRQPSIDRSRRRRTCYCKHRQRCSEDEALKKNGSPFKHAMESSIVFSRCADVIEKNLLFTNLRHSCKPG